MASAPTLLVYHGCVRRHREALPQGLCGDGGPQVSDSPCEELGFRWRHGGCGSGGICFMLALGSADSPLQLVCCCLCTLQGFDCTYISAVELPAQSTDVITNA